MVPKWLPGKENGCPLFFAPFACLLGSENGSCMEDFCITVSFVCIATNPHSDDFFGTDYHHYVGHHCIAIASLCHMIHCLLISSPLLHDHEGINTVAMALWFLYPFSFPENYMRNKNRNVHFAQSKQNHTVLLLTDLNEVKLNISQGEL